MILEQRLRTNGPLSMMSLISF